MIDLEFLLKQRWFSAIIFVQGESSSLADFLYIISFTNQCDEIVSPRQTVDRFCKLTEGATFYLRDQSFLTPYTQSDFYASFQEFPP